MFIEPLTISTDANQNKGTQYISFLLTNAIVNFSGYLTSNWKLFYQIIA